MTGRITLLDERGEIEWVQGQASRRWDRWSDYLALSEQGAGLGVCVYTYVVDTYDRWMLGFGVPVVHQVGSMFTISFVSGSRIVSLCGGCVGST